MIFDLVIKFRDSDDTLLFMLKQIIEVEKENLHVSALDSEEEEQHYVWIILDFTNVEQIKALLRVFIANGSWFPCFKFGSSLLVIVRTF